MTEQVFDNITKVLMEHFDFDELETIEFAIKYERVSGERIPIEWIKKLTK